MNLPDLVAFDLDGTFWKRSSNNSLVLRPDIARIMTYLYNHKVKMAVCSRHGSQQEAQDFFTQHSITIKGVKRTLMSLIAPGCFVIKNRDKKYHFRVVNKQTGITFGDMLLFDDLQVNSDVHTGLGVNFSKVGSQGLDWKSFKNGLKSFDDSSSSSSSTSSDSSSSDSDDGGGGGNTPSNPQMVLDARYKSFTRKLVNITTGDWSKWPESIANTYKGDILWTDGNANHAFVSSPSITAYKVVRRYGNVATGSVMTEGMASASPYYFSLQG
ncbi:acid phosphatase-domain-containing protein [Mycena vulgaris]|nr:acid phosphatase-domain-containing protein [Mycena vulgaris]